MTAKIYLSLFQRRDKLMLLGFSVFFLFVAVAVTRSRHGEIENEFLFFFLGPIFGLGCLLGEIGLRPLRLPATVLLPGLQRILFRRHIWLVLAVALIWGSIFHWLDDRIPLIPVLGLSAGIATLPLGFAWRWSARRDSSWLIGLFWGVTLGVNLPAIATSGIARAIPILAHSSIAGTIGWAMLALNLQLAWRQRPAAGLVRHLLAKNRLLPSRQRVVSWWHLISGRTEPVASPRSRWNYSLRRDSLFRRVQATFQESPAGFWMNVTGPSVIIFVHPWIAQRSAGYPLGWYRVIFDPAHSGESHGSMLALIVALTASALRPGQLRASQFYPISRQQRLAVAFTASAVGFCCSFLVIAGGSVAAGWLVGSLSGLPLPLAPAAAFLTRMAMVVPFLPLMRWGALHLELRQSFAELFLFMAVVAVFVSLGQSFVLQWGLRVGIVISLGSIAVSQVVYYVALRGFHRHGDLLQRGARPQASEAA